MRTVGVVLWLALALALLFTADVLWLSCDRDRDRCDFASHQLGAETHEGHVALSQVQYLVDTVSVTRTAGRGTLSRARFRFVLSDGRSVHLEPESRTALLPDGIIERFQAFRLERQPRMERWALHLGHGGLAALAAMAIGAVLVILGLAREIDVDFSRRMLRVRVSGMRVKREDFECSFDEVVGLEVVKVGPMIGVWLLLRSGRRAQLDFEPQPLLPTTMSQRLGLPLAAQSSEVVAKSGAETRRGGAIVVLLLGSSPLLLSIVWPFLERAL